MRGLFASLFGAFIVSCSGCGGGGGGSAAPVVAAAPATPVSSPATETTQGATPESDYTAIAQATLQQGAPADQLAARVTLVKQFIASNGGDVIYQNYLSQFGLPSDPRNTFVAETVGMNTTTLGHYYLHAPLSSGPDIVSTQCTPLFTSKGPTQKAQCALAEWDAYLSTGNTTYRAQFLTWAQYFVQLSNNGQIQWTTDWAPLGMKAPWISGLTQSQVLSVLLRAYQETGDMAYLGTAQQVYHWLTVPVSQGGIQMTVTGGVWLEEYPNATNPSHVMNGDIWGLFGVWDYYRVTQDESAEALFQSGIAALKANMSWYDLGYWNVYSHLNQKDTVNSNYMQFITQQMYVLAAITEDPFFKSLGDKWSTDQATDALFVHNMAKAFLSANPSLP